MYIYIYIASPFLWLRSQFFFVEIPSRSATRFQLSGGGELGEWIVKKGVFDELSARHVFMQIAQGHLASMGI